MSDHSIHREEFLIRSYDMDFTGHLSIQSLGRYLQEIAGNHAARLGVSVWDLSKLDLTWVLSRLHVKLDHLPRWGERLEIITWPSGRLPYYALRDFELRDSSGRRCGTATTSWMTLNVKTQKADPLPEIVEGLKIPDRARALPDEFKKLPLPDRTDGEYSYAVRRSDLDINQHVNNVSYIDWVIESVSLELLKTHTVAGLEISYRAETKYGDEVIVRTGEGDGVIRHQLLASRSQREVARAAVHLRPIQSDRFNMVK